MRCRPYRQKCVHADETKYVHCVAVVALCDLAEPADSLLTVCWGLEIKMSWFPADTLRDSQPRDPIRTADSALLRLTSHSVSTCSHLFTWCSFWVICIDIYWHALSSIVLSLWYSMILTSLLPFVKDTKCRDVETCCKVHVSAVSMSRYKSAVTNRMGRKRVENPDWIDLNRSE
jgi:hypothetical protein